MMIKHETRLLNENATETVFCFPS